MCLHPTSQNTYFVTESFHGKHANSIDLNEKGRRDLRNNCTFTVLCPVEDRDYSSERISNMNY